MSIGNRIFELLGAEKSKQVELANALNISASTLNSWKIRHSDPPAKYITGIAGFFHVSSEYLLTGQETTAMGESISPQEAKLLTAYRALGAEGKTIVLATAYKEQRRLNV